MKFNQIWSRRLGIVLLGLVATIEITFSDVAKAQSTDSVVQVTAESLGLSQVSYDQLPFFGTFWLASPGGSSGILLAPLPTPTFDATLPIYNIVGNEYLVDGTGGQVLPARMATNATTATVAAAVQLETDVVSNLINQIQVAEAPSPMTMTAGSMMMTTMDSGTSGPPVPRGSGGGSYSPDGGTNTPPGLSNTPPDYSTNLWIAQTAVASGYLNGIGSNTLADIEYEIQSRTNLSQSDWQSEGFISGSEVTNWTPLSVFQNGRPILFLRLRSWVDSYDIGIPDWWQFEYFGTNGIDPNASAAGDGYSNLQKFQMGLNPTNYYNPNGPPGFFGYLDATGTNVFIAWSPAPGPVVNYWIQRGISNSLSGLYTYSQVGTVSSNASFIEDVGAINNSNATNNIYQLEAVYPGDSLSATDTWQVSWFSLFGSNGMPFGPPAPTNFYACADTNAANVLLSWTPASGVATNYLIERGIFNATSNAYVYRQIASVGPKTNTFKVTAPFTNANNWSDDYAVVAIYPGAVAAPLAVSPINVGDTNGPAAPASFYGYADGTGANLVLAWTPAAGTPTNYVIFEGNTNSLGACAYSKLAAVSGTITNMVVTNGINNLYQTYAIFAVYADGSMSQAAFWQYANGTPTPGNFIAYFDATGTNVWLSWTAPTGAITGYLITRDDPPPSDDVFEYIVSSRTTSFEDTNAVNIGSFDPINTLYTIQVLYPNGGASSTVWTFVGTLPPPTGLESTLDASGKNVNITWLAVPGAIDYVIQRGVMNPATGTYTYTTIGTVGSGVTSFTDVGAIMTANSYNNLYQVEAIFPGGVASQFTGSGVSESSAIPLSNVYVSANLIRNGTGRWQVMFSGLPTNSPQTVQLTFNDDLYDVVQTNLCTTNLTSGVYPIPDAFTLYLLSYGFVFDLSVQLFGPNGEPGQIVEAGFFGNDAPYFVDGRRHMKQNLNFLLRAASINQLFFSTNNAGSLDINELGGNYNGTSTSFEEFSFLHHGFSAFEDLDYFQLDDLWPFTANYDLANYFVDTTRIIDTMYGSTNFVFTPDFTTNIPAPPILTHADPYWILQPGFNLINGLGYSPASDWGVSLNTSNTEASLNSSSANLFGLPYQSGCVVGFYATNTYNFYDYQTLNPANSVTLPENYTVNCYASWCPAPTLSIVNYYFAPLLPAELGFAESTGVVLPGEMDPNGGSNVQPFPVPIEEDFNVTNQTPPIIVSVGQPMVIGGWAKYAVGSSGKFAYLGQYFQTNVFLLNSSGVPTTNSAGVMSPYGEFFPLQAGMAQFTTMPDVDTGAQGTGVVQIISLNVDANHDGVMDLSDAGPDQTSPSRPFRFWINDDQDLGDDGGTGIPGKGQWGDANMDVSADDYRGFVEGAVHGRRDLVDFFPVYLNIQGLVQALPPGPNVKYILKQADDALRFCYTDLTPTNYMNFLRDTNESGNLATNLTMTISPEGYILDDNFIRNIVTNNQGILLMEGCKNTTDPLVLEIWQGSSLYNGESADLFTPQKKLGQTTLPLSLSGVEQMFRHKNILLDASDAVMPDRLTDASVPNEPDTIDKNFVFLHGYNVNPTQARGWGADLYKRLYWSGSHAKFYAVTWEGSDSQVAGTVSINLQTNIVHAFNTAPLLNNFLNSLSGINVLAAHSLGNMVVLSTLNDCGNQNIDTYCMIDAAVAIEAIDSSAPLNPDMYSSAWTNYVSRLWASKWCNLFPTNDARSQLTWSGRLANLQDTSVYNFYSSGEEVLRDYPADPPETYIDIVASQLVSIWEGNSGENAWAFQEKLKGLMPGNGFLSSNHGGWQMNEAYETNIITYMPMSPSAAAGLTTNQLQTNAFFNVSSVPGSSSPFTSDLALESSGGSAYAQTYQNRILSDAIPCLTLPVGANPVPRLQSPESPVQLNFDMQGTYENGWPAGRPARTTGVSAAGEWHHSDVRAVAYTFTYPLFNQMVIVGNLK